MIAFGTAITLPEQCERWAEPGIRRVMEPDSKIYAHQTTERVEKSPSRRVTKPLRAAKRFLRRGGWVVLSSSPCSE